MADFNEIKEKVITTLGAVADTTKELAGKAAEKAKGAARIAKLSMEINGEKDTIKKAYLEIGKLYYEMNRDNPDGFFAQLCDEITVANAEIAAKEAEIADIKENGIGGADEEDVEVEFTECEPAAEESCDCGSEAEEEKCCCEAEEEKCCCEEPAEEKTEDEPCCCEEKKEEE